jgi:hypothetical protein
MERRRAQRPAEFPVLQIYGTKWVVNVNWLERIIVNIIFIAKIFASKLEKLIVN